jgi:hypothetical protein
MKTILLSTIFVIFFCLSGYGQERHSLFSDLLKSQVSAGKVNYKSLCSDDRLDGYLAQLAKTNPDTIDSTKDKLAFWINAYNAYTLKIICDNYPLESINDLHSGGLILGTVFKSTIWDNDFVIIKPVKNFGDIGGLI